MLQVAAGMWRQVERGLGKGRGRAKNPNLFKTGMDGILMRLFKQS
jgi:hypothetical protein